ncbi:hypothetical protein HNY73_018992 [Argiope bruennichi]|uniref:Uncharacterized protein n=1 Tax=Argiope bruennichi TaxID=94029 RepID=A0A8T0EF12_ARGBR|nr:hypothetical protein HNY73_018992 [Argiope bruennichi]
MNNQKQRQVAQKSDTIVQKPERTREQKQVDNRGLVLPCVKWPESETRLRRGQGKEGWPGKTNFCIEKESFSLCEKHLFREDYPGIERALGHRKALFPGTHSNSHEQCTRS